MPRPLVDNAANGKQVKAAKGKERIHRSNELDDIRALLATSYGRRFLWRLMEKCKVLESIWEPSAKIHYNAGQQDIGHFVMGEIVEADPTAFIGMMQENKEEVEEPTKEDHDG